MNDDSAIIAKYATSTSLSDNANILILRKRDLILNSKKWALRWFMKYISISIFYYGVD